MSDREFICPVNLANSDGEIKAPLVLYFLGLKSSTTGKTSECLGYSEITLYIRLGQPCRVMQDTALRASKNELCCS